MRTGLGESPQVLLNGVPMKGDEISADSFEEAVVSQILRLTPQLQKDVYHVGCILFNVFFIQCKKLVIHVLLPNPYMNI